MTQLLTRREFVRGLAIASSAISLSGCCSLGRLVRPGVDGKTLVIDPHCHVFNARDLDIYNYLEPDIGCLYKLSLPVFYAITELLRVVAPTAEKELGHLNDWHAERSTYLQSAVTREEVASRDAEFVVELRKRIAELEQETVDERKRILTAEDPRSLILDAWSTRGVSISAARQMEVIQNLPAAIRELRSPALLAFLEGFWHYRIVNAQRLGNTYEMVSLFTPAMMDTDSWFQHRARHPIEPSTKLPPQLQIYEKIAVLTNGRFLPFVAVDPRRYAESERPFSMIDELAGVGFVVGIKLYPPMGYRPAFNADRDSFPNEDWWPGLGKAMDGVLDKCFYGCLQHELSVMAHANRSHASDDDYLDNCSPENWRRALATHPALKVNLGHFGGMTNESSWRGGFCDLMKDFPGVYADTADFAQITDRKIRTAFFADLSPLMKDPHSPLRERLMYGSDFFMNGIYRCYEDYADDWISHFRSHFPDDWRRFAGRNAADFLSLRRGRQRERLDQFFAANRLAPAWVELIE